MDKESLLAKKLVNYSSTADFASQTKGKMDDQLIQQEVDRRVAAALAKRERVKEEAPPPYTPMDPAAPTTQVMLINNPSVRNNVHNGSGGRLIALDGPTCGDLCCCPCNTAKHYLSSTNNCRECPCDAKCCGTTLLECLKGCGELIACFCK